MASSTFSTFFPSAGPDCVLAAALRDVFAAASGAELALAVERCLGCIGNDSDGQGAAYDTADPELEYAFNRLFIGPKAPPAPLYASVYLEREPQIMGESTLEVRELYRALGLCHAQEGHVPDDHLALELDVWLALETLCQNAPDNEALQAARRWLVAEHMSRWLPCFLKRAEDALDDAPPALGAVLCALRQWLDSALRQVAA